MQGRRDDRRPVRTTTSTWGCPQGQAAKHNLIAYFYTGMTPVQVLQAATLNDAKLLGKWKADRR
jgi:imidazolonepropionase-like amidohydrolase